MKFILDLTIIKPLSRLIKIIILKKKIKIRQMMKKFANILLPSNSIKVIFENNLTCKIHFIFKKKIKTESTHINDGPE